MPNTISDHLEAREQTVDLDARIFRQAGYQLIDDIAAFLSGVENYPVTPAPLPHIIRELLPAKMPQVGADASTLVKEAWDLMVNHSLFNGHPRFWGYITSSAAPLGMLADLLASAINSNCGAFVLSPMATEIEKQTIQWLGQFIGYPAAGGIMVSGGNMANFVGFVAGRKAKADWDIRKEGLYPSQGKWRVYSSADTHTWINKAADLFGLGLDAISWIPIDKFQRMDMEALEEKIKADKKEGLVPMMIIGTAGSVGTGAVDDLEKIALISKRENCWFHIDGAYGGFAAALPEMKSVFKGVELADSIAIDPHKWLYSPLEAGCTLVRDPKALTAAFSFHPVYFNFDGKEEPETNFYEQGFQNSRGFRALKVWLEFRHLGADGHAQLIREDIRLAQSLYSIFETCPEIETFTQHLSIVTFRYCPQEAKGNQQYLNKLNQELLDKLQFGGEVFPSNAIIDGNFVLRVCIVNFRTRLQDVRNLQEIVLREGGLLHKKMREQMDA